MLPPQLGDANCVTRLGRTAIIGMRRSFPGAKGPWLLLSALYRGRACRSDMDPITLAYILIAIGVVLVLAEMFVPTGFILVVIGACLALVGVGLLFAYGTMETAVMALLSLCVGGPLLGGLLFLLLPYCPVARRLSK